VAKKKSNFGVTVHYEQKKIIRKHRHKKNLSKSEKRQQKPYHRQGRPQ
jgi:hypothetical protein